MSKHTGTGDIGSLRGEIDGINAELVRLLNRRAALAQQIGALKGGKAVYKPEREAQVLAQVRALAGDGPLSADAIEQVFNEVISVCRALEQTLTVSFLGPVGTFSEMAVARRFGHSVTGLPCASIDETFRSAETGAAQFAVVPVENSTEGAIGRTLDLMLGTSLRICGEVELRVQQNLMATQPAMDAIKRVYSHPQSLGQCAGWLGAHLPAAERVPLSSNAEAARRASQEPGTAAIGPAIAAEKYGLTLLAESIEDDARNKTRFLVLGAEDAAPSGRDRTSLAMSAHNRPGAVLELISPFARHGVSMTRIESRPARTGQWEYHFFVDVLGHRNDPGVRAALDEVREKAPFLKVFGSYPAA